MLHSWQLTPREAIELQKKLAPMIIRQDQLNTINYIAGVDVGFEKIDGQPKATLTRAVVVILAFPELTICETVIHREPTKMPYIPGLLSFRELPAVINAFSQVQQWPDLVMVDGHGIAHPRGLGNAAHLGLWLDLPTIGIAKKRLFGVNAEVPNEIGQWVPLLYQQHRIGAVLRSRLNVKPLYVSIGHKISLPTALQWVKECLRGYRLPEPTRQADRIASRRTREFKANLVPI